MDLEGKYWGEATILILEYNWLMRTTYPAYTIEPFRELFNNLKFNDDLFKNLYEINANDNNILHLITKLGHEWPTVMKAV